MVRGAAGIVTDGGLRDSQSITKHAVDSQVPIGCGGVAVYPGDVVVGDQEGVVVIPAGIADEVAREASAQSEFEDWVEGKVKEGRSIFGLYPPSAQTKAEYEAWKKKQGRPHFRKAGKGVCPRVCPYFPQAEHAHLFDAASGERI